MSQTPATHPADQPAAQTRKGPADLRELRLKAALKANLARRKAQTRARTDDTESADD